MDWGWVSQVLTLLFGQVGVLGTVLIAMVGTLLWLLWREQEAHDKTREQVALVNEKRIELAINTLNTLHELRNAVNALAEEIKRKRPR